MADILVVEDDEDVSLLIETFLELQNHRVRSASDGEKGLAALDVDHLPDLVVMDVEMPLLGGPGMAARMLALDVGRERIPLVLVSGAEGLESIARRVGTPYFLAKPFAPDVFLSLVTRALKERRYPIPPRPPSRAHRHP